MTIEELKTKGLLLFECISGSRSYNLDLPQSDTDLKGVFIAPQESFFGLVETKQINNESNDEVYYELGRFVDLLCKSNPNIIELLAIRSEFVQHHNPLFSLFKPKYFLSKKCKDTFAGYAQTQIRKARGLNKKMLNPMSEEKKNILDFCYVLRGITTVPLKNWLKGQNSQQEFCGLVSINHSKGLFGLYYGKEKGFKGIMAAENSQDVSLSSIPKGEKLEAYLSFNVDAYSQYCKDYKEYWAWVEKRNEHRYQNTMEHGKNYDAKNMMHTFRLLDMAYEIATQKKINVWRENREGLLAIRAGEFSYDDLLLNAEVKLEEIENAYNNSDLPEEPDRATAEKILINIRRAVYGD